MKRRCVFLDRDGVINVPPAPGDYVRTWQQFCCLPPIVDWIRLFNALDFLVIVVTNQRGIARGLLQLDDLLEIHRNMVEHLRRAGARIDDVLFCPHDEGCCSCRKPLPGLILEAQRRWDIDLSGSLLIGDSEADRQLALNCGLRFLRVQSGRILDCLPADSVTAAGAPSAE